MRLARSSSILAACALGVLACRGNDRGAQTTTTTAAGTERNGSIYDPQPASQPTSQPYAPQHYGIESTGPDTSGMSGMGGVGASMIPYPTATTRITEAHCDREASCDELGTSKRFPTREGCIRDQGKKTQQEVKSSECQNGIDESRLQTCLGRIAVQECTDLVMSLANVDACSAATLCKR